MVEPLNPEEIKTGPTLADILQGYQEGKPFDVQELLKAAENESVKTPIGMTLEATGFPQQRLTDVLSNPNAGVLAGLDNPNFYSPKPRGEVEWENKIQGAVGNLLSKAIPYETTPKNMVIGSIQPGPKVVAGPKAATAEMFTPPTRGATPATVDQTREIQNKLMNQFIHEEQLMSPQEKAFYNDTVRPLIKTANAENIEQTITSINYIEDAMRNAKKKVMGMGGRAVYDPRIGATGNYTTSNVEGMTPVVRLNPERIRDPETYRTVISHEYFQGHGLQDYLSKLLNNPVKELFKHPKIEALTEAMAKAQGGEAYTSIADKTHQILVNSLKDYIKTNNAFPKTTAEWVPANLMDWVKSTGKPYLQGIEEFQKVFAGKTGFPLFREMTRQVNKLGKEVMWEGSPKVGEAPNMAFPTKEIRENWREETGGKVLQQSKGAGKSTSKQVKAGMQGESVPKDPTEYIPTGPSESYVSPKGIQPEPTPMTTAEFLQEADADKISKYIKDPALRERFKEAYLRTKTPGTAELQLPPGSPKDPYEVLASLKQTQSQLQKSGADVTDPLGKQVTEMAKTDPKMAEELLRSTTEPNYTQIMHKKYGNRPDRSAQDAANLKSKTGTAELQGPPDPQTILRKYPLPKSPKEAVETLTEVQKNKEWLDTRTLSKKDLNDLISGGHTIDLKNPLLEEPITPAARKRMANNLKRMADSSWMPEGARKLAQTELDKITDWTSPDANRFLEFAAERLHQGTRQASQIVSDHGMTKWKGAFEKAYKER